jgi:hypothetical protein
MLYCCFYRFDVAVANWESVNTPEAFGNIIHPEDEEAVMQAFAECVRGRNNGVFDTTYR